MRIATFNVNSVRARIANILEWLDEAQPDVVLLQEIKTINDDFPEFDFQAKGYHCAIHGQKSYNGVAILSKHPIEDILIGLPGEDGRTSDKWQEGDENQARYIEATIQGIRVASIYLPNGNPVDTVKYPFKLRWMDRLYAHIKDNLLPLEMPIALGGDYNICPDDRDVYDPPRWANDALCKPESRAKFRALINLGLTEAWRSLHPHAEQQYSYWDYVKGRYQKDEGLRIDHFLLSPQATDILEACEIDKTPRAKEKASDHTPVILTLKDIA
ncbi:exodeoxyribonuclease III [Curvivirga sp.]|uniref:exodeoxyribonuclease III n=1 Tax=Curvivirga sp. TaxID=2856848 RepID=UPI003B5C3C31